MFITQKQMGAIKNAVALLDSKTKKGSEHERDVVQKALEAIEEMEDNLQKNRERTAKYMAKRRETDPTFGHRDRIKKSE